MDHMERNRYLTLAAELRRCASRIDEIVTELSQPKPVDYGKYPSAFIRRIKRAGGEPVSVRELQRFTGNRISADEIRAILDRMEQNKIVRQVLQEAPEMGRPPAPKYVLASP